MPPNLIDLAIPAFLLLLIIEAIVDARMRTDLYERQDTFASLAMGIGNVVVNLVAKGLQFGILLWLYKFRLFTLGTAWWAWVALFFADEFSYYWYHRTSHECRLFWASHVVHHSSQKYNLSTALRQTWTGSFMGFIFWLWLPLVGFLPWMIVTMQAVSLLYQFWIHTEIIKSMGPLEAVLNTPSHHRVHHGSNPEYIDRNHGGTLIVWDRLFRSFEPERARVRYGLTKNINTYNPFRIAFHEWIDIVRDVRRAPGLGNKLRYIFGRPGWSHEQDADAPPAAAAASESA